MTSGYHRLTLESCTKAYCTIAIALHRFPVNVSLAFLLQSWSRVSAVPSSAVPLLSAVKIACHDPARQRTTNTVLHHPGIVLPPTLVRVSSSDKAPH